MIKLRNKRVLKSLLATGLLMAGSSFGSEIIRYGQLGLTESSTGVTPDIWISFAGGWQTNTTTGTLGSSLHLAGPGDSISNSVTGSGVAIIINDITGTTDARLGSNGAGSILGIRGATNDRIDPGEEVSFVFNQDVKVKYISSLDVADVTVDVNGTSYDGTVAANGGSPIVVNEVLSAGDLLTLGSAVSAWRVRSIVIETIDPVPDPPAKSVSIRYGQVGATDGVDPDIWIAFDGEWQTNSTTGDLGETLNQQPAGATLTDTISGSGVQLTVSSIGGTADPKTASNGAGSILGIRGTTNDRIDPGETVSLTFTQDVLVKYVRSHDAATITGSVNSVSFSETVSANGNVTLNTVLPAGEELTLGSSNGIWRVKSIFVETIVEVEPPVEAVTVRYGHITQTDPGKDAADINISFSARYLYGAITNETSGALGDNFNLATGGELILDTVSGSGLGLYVDSVTGGTGQLAGNTVGSVLAVKGGSDYGATMDANKIIDTNETFAFRFDSDVVLKYITTQSQLTAYTIHGSAGRVGIEGSTDVTFLEDTNATSVVELGDVILPAGSNLTFSTDSGAWALRSLVVESIPPVQEVSYSEWIQLYGLTNSPDADPDYDYDGDELDNLSEFGLGGDPTDADSTGHTPQMQIVDAGSSNLIEYVYPRRTTEGNGLTYYLELSQNLTGNTWTNSGYTTLPETGVIDESFESVTNLVPVDVDQKFIRLRISD